MRVLEYFGGLEKNYLQYIPVFTTGVNNQCVKYIYIYSLEITRNIFRYI